VTLGTILVGEDVCVISLLLVLDVAASLSCTSAAVLMQSRIQINILCTFSAKSA
jgi:hypothetical protein